MRTCTIIDLFCLSSAAAVTTGVGLRGSTQNSRPRVQDLSGVANFEPDGSGIVNEPEIWEGASIATEFRVMDDLEPIAPMDRLTEAERPQRDIPNQDVTEPTPTQDIPSTDNALSVPKFLRADAFPAVHGQSCTCGPPEATAASEAASKLLPGPHADIEAQAAAAANREALERAYGKEAVEELIKRAVRETSIKCNCTGDDNGRVYHYAKWEPIYNSSQYVLAPADVTYHGGDYWAPKVHGGIVAPADKMPTDRYPLQAFGDEIKMIPATSRGDRISDRFAKYFDQVEYRAAECDTVSEECTTPCQKGDEVNVRIGNVDLNATVLTTHEGNALQIEFVTAASQAKNPDDATPPLPCGLSDGCTVFRPCRPTQVATGAACTEQEEIFERDFTGNLRRGLKCPASTVMCRTVAQMVEGSFLRRNGKACKATATTLPA